MAAENVTNYVTTTLNMPGGLTAGATSITIASAAGFPTSGQYRILMDSEIALVTAGQGTLVWTVTRGQEGTSAASHVNSATVANPLTSTALKNLSLGNGLALAW